MEMKIKTFTFSSPVKNPQKFQMRKTAELSLLEEKMDSWSLIREDVGAQQDQPDKRIF